MSRLPLWAALAGPIISVSAVRAQVRGVYPAGMSAVNSGVTPGSGFTYSNVFLFYSRDQLKDANGETTATGKHAVILDMNNFIWVSKRTILGGAKFSLSATLPIANNSLTSDLEGSISGGGGFGDSYFQPFILGWQKKRVDIRVVYGFLAPTGRFNAAANDNVGSGYWTHALSTGQTFYLKENKRLSLSAFQMYEFHTLQEGTGVHPGETFDLDYSIMYSAARTPRFQLQAGLAGYEQRQTTAKTGPGISLAASEERYAVNALGFAVLGVLPKRKASVGLKYFKEFANRSTFQGYSLQFVASIGF